MIGLKKNTILILCNIILILIMIVTVVIYSNTALNQNNTIKCNTFCNMVESVKQVSENYIKAEKGYVNNWARYISSQNMTAEQALSYVRITNTQTDRTAHLVDMEDMSARSAETEWVHCYSDLLKDDTEYNKTFLKKMEKIFNADDNSIFILGKYDAGQTVISVGSRVTIRENDGSDKDYLLLRLIPVEYLEKTWVFPTEFPTAEISFINSDGRYIVKSPSLRSENFFEFINDYNEVNEPDEKFSSAKSGMLEYQNSDEDNCYFYYSSLELDEDVFILGYIPVSEIKSDIIDWSIVTIICTTLVVLIILDGSHVLQINKQLRKAVITAQKANNAKTRFLSSMSHDIRTPMNVVIGMTEIARKHLDDISYVKDCLDKVSMSGNHLLTLINDILDISKVESGKMPLNPCTFSLHNFIEEIEILIKQSADNKNISFTLDMNNIKHDTLIGDPLRIRQVLINLLTNSIKYTENGGHIKFSVSEISENDNDDKNSVFLKFVVDDDGIGMSEDFQKNMYVSFARATDSRINSIQGSGLGLAIVKQMVELMNGSVQCESILGKGTVFTVIIKLGIADSLPENKDNQPKLTDGHIDEFAGMKVLVAEDNDLNFMIIQTLLEEHQVTANRAVNGQVCLDILNNPDSPHYDLVFMDVQMPVMNGKEATRKIRKSENSYIKNIPVVAMTADAFAEDVYECLSSGMDEHLSKPISMSHILQVLRKARNGTLRRK